MKQITLPATLLLAAIATLSISCKKGDAPDGSEPGPIVLSRSEGILVTMGFNSNNQHDTIAVVIGNGTRDIGGYSYGLVDKKYELQIQPSGNGGWWLVKKTPYIAPNGKSYKYVGYQKNLTVGDPTTSGDYSQEYLTKLYEHSGPECEFVMNKTNDQFFLEPMNLRGYFINSYRHPYTSGNAYGHHKLVFETKKQNFFFLEK
jgi:hypothetical protein